MNKNFKILVMSVFLVLSLTGNLAFSAAHAQDAKNLIIDEFPFVPVLHGVGKDREWYAHGYVQVTLHKKTGRYSVCNITRYRHWEDNFSILAPSVNGQSLFFRLENLYKRRRDQRNLFCTEES